MRAILVTVTLWVTVLSSVAHGASQASPPPAPPPPAPAASTPQQTPAPPADAASTPSAPPDTYVYQPDGRRDPFVSALGTGSEPRMTGKRGEGPAGMLTAEISVRGIMQHGTSLLALVQGPDNRTYIVRAGDKLMDGTIKAVTREGLTIVQDVNDPLSLVKTREVRRPLRSLEDAKP